MRLPKTTASQDFLTFRKLKSTTSNFPAQHKFTWNFELIALNSDCLVSNLLIDLFLFNSCRYRVKDPVSVVFQAVVPDPVELIVFEALYYLLLLIVMWTDRCTEISETLKGLHSAVHDNAFPPGDTLGVIKGSKRFQL